MAWVIAFKYLSVMMRADNNGEGGILALLALALRGLDGEPRMRWFVIMLGIFGAAMFYGDSMITPAISVLSAVEGLEVATPVFSHWVVPATIAILTALFLIQRHGTASVGALFGPITALWFLSIGAVGIWRISENPAILAAANPAHAVSFLVANPLLGFLVLGAVFLALTGGEALYADMGHFGKRPIRIAWFGLVMPALLLNYFGQGAFVLANPAGAKNPFYLMLPEWGVLPMVVLATAATVIASQAVISGAFSMTRQAIQLGYIPRLEILHTSSRAIGQIYVPFVNWTLFVAVVLLVLGFKTSGNLANAYGIAVAATMVIECLLAMVVARRLWKWSPLATWGIIGSMLVVDLFFFASNAAKFLSGGWFPLLIGAACYTLLVTWKRGRTLLARRLADQGIPLEPFLESLALSPPQRVPGTAIFMTGQSATVPSALLHNLKHNKVLHERVVFLTVVTHDVPVVPRRGPHPAASASARASGDRGVVRVQGAARCPGHPRGLQEAVRARVRADGDVVLPVAREHRLRRRAARHGHLARPPVRVDEPQRDARHGLLQHSHQPRGGTRHARGHLNSGNPTGEIDEHSRKQRRHVQAGHPPRPRRRRHRRRRLRGRRRRLLPGACCPGRPRRRPPRR